MNCKYPNCQDYGDTSPEYKYCTYHFIVMSCTTCSIRSAPVEGGKCRDCCPTQPLPKSTQNYCLMNPKVCNRVAKPVDDELSEWESGKELLMNTISRCNKAHIAVITDTLDEIITKTKRKRDEDIQSTKKQKLEEENGEKKKSVEVINDQSTDICSICKENKKDSTTACGHRFCYGCITSWLEVKNECPICKGPHPFVIKFFQ